MDLNPQHKPHPLAAIPAASLLSMIAGAVAMYYAQEGRIEKRAEERTTTAIALESLKGQQAKLDSREWDNANRLKEEIDRLKAECSAAKDRLLRIELKNDSIP